MSEQLSDIGILFRKRTVLIGNISQKNAEHLRIVQMRSGIEVLLLKEQDSAQVNQQMSEADTKITNSLAALSDLEADLAKIDQQIEIALNKEA